MHRILINVVAALSDREKQMLFDGYRGLFAEKPMSQADIAPLLAVFPYIVCESGRVLSIFGLDTRSSQHKITIGSVRRYTWCIWDAFFIAESLGNDALIETIDPISKQSLVINYISGRWSVDMHLWTSFPVQSHCSCTLRQGFCHYVHLFAHHNHALAYRTQHGCSIEPVQVLISRSHEMAAAIRPSPLDCAGKLMISA